jgi:hypothetical protein
MEWMEDGAGGDGIDGMMELEGGGVGQDGHKAPKRETMGL